MAVLGEAFSGGAWRRLYAPRQVPGLGISLAVALVLIVLNQVLQAAFGIAFLKVMFGGDATHSGDLVKAYMVGLFPAAVFTVVCAVALARLKGGSAVDILSLRFPQLSPAGWLVLVLGFLLAIYAAIVLVLTITGIDPSQFTPTEGQDNSETVGVVKQAMFDIAHDPRLFLIVLPSVVVGAPLAEEMIFRGQLFNALAHSRAGVSGATLVTAAAWAILHLSEPLFAVGIIFLMGLAFGYLIYRFNSLWVTIACHAAWNSIYSLVMFGSVGTS